MQQLVHAISAQGIKCSVIAPVSIMKNLSDVPFHYQEGENQQISVIRPQYLSASNKNFFFFNTFDLTQINFERAVGKGIRALDSHPSLFYGHFLYPSAKAAIRFSEKYHVPCVAAVGESNPNNQLRTKSFINKPSKDFQGIDGFVAVSRDNARFCVQKLGIPAERIEVLPNSVDFNLFYPRNQEEMREKYHLPQDKFIVAFTGHFIERKGPDRVLKAVEGLDNIGVIFMGEGKISLEGKQVLFKGAVEHHKVPELLSAADIFVLPTLAEGSCNAIIEAMACGLPVVSSKGSYNEGILNDNVAILVDPLNIKEIRSAIIQLSKNQKRVEIMSHRALSYSKSFDLKERARKISDMLHTLVSSDQGKGQ